MTNMNIIGIIPSRYNSTRFPGKPLVDIDGKSMIQRVYEQAQKVKSFSKIIVATDDARIEEHVKSFGGDAMMTSTVHQSGTDRCGEVVRKLTENYDVVVNIQGDEPFIQPEQLEKLITAFSEEKTQIATLAIKLKNSDDIFNSNIVKVVFSVSGNALYFSRNPIPFNRGEEKENWLNTSSYYKHLGIYAYRSDILRKINIIPPSSLEISESLEQLRWLENDFTIKIVETDIDTIGIDTPEDLAKT